MDRSSSLVNSGTFSGTVRARYPDSAYPAPLQNKGQAHIWSLCIHEPVFPEWAELLRPIAGELRGEPAVLVEHLQCDCPAQVGIAVANSGQTVTPEVLPALGNRQRSWRRSSGAGFLRPLDDRRRR